VKYRVVKNSIKWRLFQRKERTMSKTLLAKISMVVVSTLVFAVYANDTTPASGAKICKIGAVLMLTGPASQGGLACKQGYQLVVDKYNSEGGLKVGNDTYMIELIVEDDQMSPERASIAATKLITQDKANIIIGGLIPNLGRAVYEVTSKAGVLYVTPSVNLSAVIPYPENIDVCPDRPLLIRTYHSYDEVVPGLLDYMVEQYPDVKTVALNHIAEETAEPMAGYVKKELEKRGLRQVGKLEQFAPDIQDYVPLVTRILANKPDVIFCLIGNPINAGGELKAARDLGFEGPLFYVIHADVALQAKIAGGNVSDMFGAMLTLADPDSLPQEANDVIAQYLKKYPKRELIGDVLYAYDSLWVALQTIEKAKSLNPETIVKTYEGLTQLGDLQTTLGPAYVGGQKTCGVNRVICAPYAIARVTDGVSKNVKFVMLDIP
jgi:branched-chain amino acid transport system substrate-binding protein